MGLDGIELALAFEERFGVTITDAEAEASTTPRQVIDVVFAKLRTADETICVNQRAFHILRRTLIDQFSVHRRDAQLDNDLRGIVCIGDDPRLWAGLNAHPARPPHLAIRQHACRQGQEPITSARKPDAGPISHGEMGVLRKNGQ